jgi:hypothetical protein
MVGHSAERRAEHVCVFVMCAADHHYRHHPIARTLRGFISDMFSRDADWVMMGINQGVKITTERHGDSCAYR